MIIMDIKLLNKDEFLQLIKKPLYFNQYKKNTFKFLDLGMLHNDFFLVAFNNNQEIMGLIQFGANPNDQTIYWMKFIEVLPQFKGQKIASMLLEKLCNHLSSISDIQLQISAYQLDGEVLIPTIQRLALNYPQLKIKHKLRSTPYQDAHIDFLRINQEVYVEDPDSGYKGKAIVASFKEYETPLKIKLICQDESKSIIVVLPECIKVI